MLTSYTTVLVSFSSLRSFSFYSSPHFFLISLTPGNLVPFSIPGCHKKLRKFKVESSTRKFELVHFNTFLMVMDDHAGHFTDRSVQSPKPTTQVAARDQPPKWSGWKYILRWIILIAALVATITSLVGIAAPVKQSSWVFLNPLYPLPYVSRLGKMLIVFFFFF